MSRRGKSGSEKVLSLSLSLSITISLPHPFSSVISIRQTVERGRKSCSYPLSRDSVTGVGDPSRQAADRQAGRHSPDSFTHSPSAPHRIFPLDLTPCSKSYPAVLLARRSITASRSPFRPKIRFLLEGPFRAVNPPPMRITGLIRRTRCIIVSASRSAGSL